MTFNLSIVELIVLFFCAVSLGVVIHFFITSRKSLKISPIENEKLKRNIDDWKLKYFNDIEVKDKELSDLKGRLSEAEESSRIYRVEVEELQRQHKRMQADLQHASKPETGEGRPSYLEQLRIAQASLMEHNDKINRLLDDLDVVKEHEEKQKLMEDENEELTMEIKELKSLLGQKESEIHAVRQRENLTREMTSMLDGAYSEFNTLQSKIQKLESQLTSTTMVGLEYEDLKEAHSKMVRQHEEFRLKMQALTADNQQMSLQLTDAEEKFREANFQRQQLQKRVSYLEELNSDLQVVADANKKLQHQLKRIGELESLLNVVAEENQVLRKQTNA
ncbi:MAG TPA: hypothetical protein VGC95_01685 [Chitinophagaceae bacterium]|jgi:chromosome segregation ATPase